MHSKNWHTIQKCAMHTKNVDKWCFDGDKIKILTKKKTLKLVRLVPLYSTLHVLSLTLCQRNNWFDPFYSLALLWHTHLIHIELALSYTPVWWADSFLVTNATQRQHRCGCCVLRNSAGHSCMGEQYRCRSRLFRSQHIFFVFVVVT